MYNEVESEMYLVTSPVASAAVGSKAVALLLLIRR